MRVLSTDVLDFMALRGEDAYWAYNGMDCCMTWEIFDQIKGQLTESSQLIYDFERACQAPALEMMLRGVRIDMGKRQREINRLIVEHGRVQWILDQLAMAVWGKTLNPNSPLQLKNFFYKHMRLPEHHTIVKGVRKVSTNRECLEKIALNFHAEPIVLCILKLRDILKKLSVLKTGIDSDCRIRTSYNVAGTETGRWSSNENAFGTGTNLQNITGSLRDIFIADPGYKLAYIDLEQAESRVVGGLTYACCGQSDYLDACEAGDLHTLVTKMVWPGLPWTGDPTADKAIAEQKFYRDYSYRDMSKRGGHGTNYYGQAPTMAKHLKVPVPLMQGFQTEYFAAFPGIKKWHTHQLQCLQLDGHITTPLGRQRYFLGRSDDDQTLREAIAYSPQSTIGDLLNLAMWRVWKFARQWGVQLLMQIHDAIVVQYPEHLEDQIVPKLLELMKVPIPFSHKGVVRNVIIPSEAQVGWNWGKFDHKKPLDNPDGLMKWKGNDQRRRTGNPHSTLLDYVVS